MGNKGSRALAPPNDLPYYHERQVRAYCGAHALNNLLQTPWTSPHELDALARGLHAQSTPTYTPLPPPSLHSSLFGRLFPDPDALSGLATLHVGNYDLSVLQAALIAQGLAVWHVTTPGGIDMCESVLSLLTHASPTGLLLHDAGKRRDGGHWLAARGLSDGRWYEFDSILPYPQRIDDLDAYVSSRIASSRFTLLVVGDATVADPSVGGTTASVGPGGNQEELDLAVALSLSTVDADPPQEWACSFCTFVNTPTSSVCQMCQAGNPT